MSGLSHRVSNAIPQETLETLIESKYSGVFKVNTLVHVALHPKHLGNLQKGILNYFDKKINIYDTELKGILLGHGKILLKEKTCLVHNEGHHLHLDVLSDFYLFRPTIGKVLRGIVNKKSPSIVSILLHGLFHIPCYKPSEMKHKWFASEIPMNSSVLITIIKTDMTQKVPYILGTLNEMNCEEEKEEENYLKIYKMKDSYSENINESSKSSEKSTNKDKKAKKGKRKNKKNIDDEEENEQDDDDSASCSENLKIEKDEGREMVEEMNNSLRIKREKTSDEDEGFVLHTKEKSRKKKKKKSKNSKEEELKNYKEKNTNPSKDSRNKHKKKKKKKNLRDEEEIEKGHDDDDEENDETIIIKQEEEEKEEEKERKKKKKTDKKSKQNVVVSLKEKNEEFKDKTQTFKNQKQELEGKEKYKDDDKLQKENGKFEVVTNTNSRLNESYNESIKVEITSESPSKNRKRKRRESEEFNDVPCKKINSLDTHLPALGVGLPENWTYVNKISGTGKTKRKIWYDSNHKAYKSLKAALQSLAP